MGYIVKNLDCDVLLKNLDCDVLLKSMIYNNKSKNRSLFIAEKKLSDFFSYLLQKLRLSDC